MFWLVIGSLASFWSHIEAQASLLLVKEYDTLKGRFQLLAR